MNLLLILIILISIYIFICLYNRYYNYSIKDTGNFEIKKSNDILIPKINNSSIKKNTCKYNDILLKKYISINNQTEQSEYPNQPEQLNQSEYPNQSEQLNQSEYPNQSEQLNQSEYPNQSEQLNQSEQHNQSEQLNQPNPTCHEHIQIQIPQQTEIPSQISKFEYVDSLIKKANLDVNIPETDNPNCIGNVNYLNNLNHSTPDIKKSKNIISWYLMANSESDNFDLVDKNLPLHKT
jgi:hypothetical protein